MRDFDTLRLPQGYRLDLVGDPCVVTLCRADGTVVGRFTESSDLKQIRRAAEDDRREGGVGASIHPIA
jgi:hypothetical protein